jgi:hypothetical protein
LYEKLNNLIHFDLKNCSIFESAIHHHDEIQIHHSTIYIFPIFHRDSECQWITSASFHSDIIVMSSFLARYWRTVAIASVSLTSTYLYAHYDQPQFNNRLLTVHAAEYVSESLISLKF